MTETNAAKDVKPLELTKALVDELREGRDHYWHIVKSLPRTSYCWQRYRDGWVAYRLAGSRELRFLEAVYTFSEDTAWHWAGEWARQERERREEEQRRREGRKKTCPDCDHVGLEYVHEQPEADVDSHYRCPSCNSDVNLDHVRGLWG